MTKNNSHLILCDFFVHNFYRQLEIDGSQISVCVWPLKCMPHNMKPNYSSFSTLYIFNSNSHLPQSVCQRAPTTRTGTKHFMACDPMCKTLWMLLRYASRIGLVESHKIIQKLLLLGLFSPYHPIASDPRSLASAKVTVIVLLSHPHTAMSYQ